MGFWAWITQPNVIEGFLGLYVMCATLAFTIYLGEHEP